MGHTFGDGAGFQLHAADEGFADLAAPAMPLNNEQGQEVVLYRRLYDSVLDGGGEDSRSGQILVRDDLDSADLHAAMCPAGGKLQVLQLHGLPLD
ncbi:hypothetical protein D3C75_872290 [compost metagenome]